MALVKHSKKSCAVNPLKMSQPIGGALAFMGVSNCMPVLHGSQGCTSFGLVLFVRHFREAIPLQTTAMNEVATILGGLDNIEQSILNIVKRANPEVIGICSTGVTETKGDDVDGYLKSMRERRPELADLGIVYVSTPDFKDAFQDGFGKTVTKIIEAFVPRYEESPQRAPARVNVLAGCHLTPGDIDELRDIIECFGLEPTFLPDLSGSLDGHIPEDFTPTTLGGVTKADIARMGTAGWTLAIGEQMRDAALALEARAGVPFALFDRLTGLGVNDDFVAFLSKISGRPVPLKIRRLRGQLVDSMLDGHFHFGGKRIAIGAEPDLLWSVGSFLCGNGRENRRRRNDDQIAAARKISRRGGLDRRSRRFGAARRGRRPHRHAFPRTASFRAVGRAAVSTGLADVRSSGRRAGGVGGISRDAKPNFRDRQYLHRSDARTRRGDLAPGLPRPCPCRRHGSE